MHATPPDRVKSVVKLCVSVVCATLLGWTAWAATTAEQLFERAQKAERSGQLVNAYVLYAEAAAANPKNLMYWQRAQALRPTASINVREVRRLDATLRTRRHRCALGRTGAHESSSPLASE